jgi:hypothetical protein
MFRKSGNAKANGDSEAKVEAADQEQSGKTERAGGDLEVGDEPDSTGPKTGNDGGSEGIDLGRCEAIQEEVGYDKVVRRIGWMPGNGGGREG